MRRSPRCSTLSIGLLIAALAGCSLTGLPRLDDPAPPGGVEPPAQAPPIDRSLRVEPDPNIIDGRPVAIDRYAIGADGKTVVVYYWGGNETCFGLQGVRVDATGDAPLITVLEGTRGVELACTMEALLKSAVVVLDAAVVRDGSGADVQPSEPPAGLAGAVPVRPQPGVTDARAHAITAYTLSGDGRTLTAYYVGGTEECYALGEARVEDAAGTATVTLLEGSLPNLGPRACDDIGVAKLVQIELSRPLLVSAAG